MTLNKRQVLGIISSNQENQAVQRITELLSIKASNASQAVGHLSGGNQQNVVIGKAVLSQSKILLLADPTRGIDVGTKAEIYKLVGRLADEGITILFYSTELPELVGLCHRVAVFKQGRINAILCGDEVNEHEIIHASLGMA
jgi:ribose transport system ATP-binding protein